MFVLFFSLTSVGVGYEMKANRMENIPLAVLDQDGSEFSRTVIAYTEESDILTLYDYASSVEELETWFRQGRIAVGMIIPQGLAAAMVQGEAPRILLLYDASSMMLASAAKTAMSEVLLTLRGAYLRNFYEGKLSVLPDQALKNALPVGVTYRALYNPAKNFSNYLLLGMLVALLQVELAILGVERSRLGKQSFPRLLLKCLKLGAAGMAALTVCLGIQYLWFDLPYKGSLAAGILLTFLYAVCMVSFGVLLGQIVSDRTFASQVVAFLVLPTSILGGYTFPLWAMPTFFQGLGKALPYTYYGEAIRGLCLKGLDFLQVLPDVGVMVGFIALEGLLLGGVLTVKRIMGAKGRSSPETGEV
jgi:ABC-2 type transport system permease protein